MTVNAASYLSIHSCLHECFLRRTSDNALHSAVDVDCVDNQLLSYRNGGCSSVF